MAWYDFLLNPIKQELINEINTLQKNESLNQENTSATHDIQNKDVIAGKGVLVDDPFYDYSATQGMARLKSSRLSNRLLKQVSLQDWLISTIMQARIDTGVQFSRPNHDQFNTGFRFTMKDQSAKPDEIDLKNMKLLEDFVYYTGQRDYRSHETKQLFTDFLKLAVRDILTFGHISVEKVYTNSGALHHFKILPAEETYLIDQLQKKDAIEKQMNQVFDMMKQRWSDNDPRQEFNFFLQQIENYKYIQQSSEGRTLAVFGDKDLIFRVFNPQNFRDLKGYGYSPLELAIKNVTQHLNANEYNANFFTNGQASKGVLHLKGTITPQKFSEFRRQFYNTINGTANAWRTPIIAGLDDVQWIPMAGNSKDMEYLQYTDRIIRAVCSQFEIDPIELGLDYLGSLSGKPAGQQANNQFKIEYSKERGLLPILIFFENLINEEILPVIDVDFSNKYKFEFTGYTDETPQNQVNLLQSQMSTHASMNDILRKSEKATIDHIIADLPLNAVFWSLVEKNLTRGEIRETFLKDKNASNNPELKYIPGDPAFLTFNQMRKTLEASQEQMKLAASSAEQQQPDKKQKEESE